MSTNEVRAHIFVPRLWRTVFVKVLVNARQFEIKLQSLAASVGLAVDLVPSRTVLTKNGSWISAHSWSVGGAAPVAS